MEHPLFIDRFPIKISISNGFPGFPSQPRLMTPEGLLYTERVETTKPADRGPFRSRLPGLLALRLKGSFFFRGNWGIGIGI